MEYTPPIIGLGEVLWDVMPDGTRHLGGAPLNVAVHARSLGCEASVISAVGDDDPGHEALKLLNSDHGLDASAVAILPDYATGAVDVRLSAGQPTFTIRRDMAWDHIPATRDARDKATQANAIVFGTLAQRSEASRATIRELLGLTAKECLRVFDVNLRPPFYSDMLIRESIEQANVLKLNDAELPIVLAALGIVNASAWAAEILTRQPQLCLIAITRGENGSTVFTRERIEGHKLAAKKVAVKDTIGAGDAFTAALVAGLLRGRALEQLHRHAVEVAAFVCSQAGATPRIPRELAAPT